MSELTSSSAPNFITRLTSICSSTTAISTLVEITRSTRTSVRRASEAGRTMLARREEFSWVQELNSDSEHPITPQNERRPDEESGCRFFGAKVSQRQLARK